MRHKAYFGLLMQRFFFENGDYRKFQVALHISSGIYTLKLTAFARTTTVVV